MHTVFHRGHYEWVETGLSVVVLAPGATPFLQWLLIPPALLWLMRQLPLWVKDQ